jgi:hypothetical protein
MTKKLVVALIVLCLGVASFAQQMISPAPRAGVFFPVYWVLGGAKTADSNITVDGRLVLVYLESAPNVVGQVFGYGYVANGKFSADPFVNSVVETGKTYKVAIPQHSDGYGANAIDITISGLGYDQLSSDLLLAYGAGPIWAGNVGPAVKVWFGNRLYQPGIYTKANPFVVNPTPTVKAKISIVEPFTVSANPSSYSIVVDPATRNQSLQLSDANMTAKATAAEGLKGFTLERMINETEKLEEGEHTFQVTANADTANPITTLATVEVMSGPLRLIGTPITFPSPYSISKNKIVTIQYGLSADANIEIWVTGVSGQRIKHFVLNAGQEGGSAGINKVTWDGKTDQGYLAGNAIYVGTILARDENRLLGKFKLTIVD